MADTFPYYLILLTAAVPALVRQSQKPGLGWILFYILLVAFVGLRYQVGPDWEGYLMLADNAAAGSLTAAISQGDPLYFLILWTSMWAGFEIYGANIITSAIFLYGLFRYCRIMPNSWLALYSAIPFLVIVVGMSANRQAAAIGVTLLLLGTWKESSLGKRLILLLLAATLHASAGMFLVFFIVDSRLSIPKKILATVAIVGAFSYVLAVGDPLVRYSESYIGAADENFAAGAVQQILLNALPAALLLIRWRKFRDRTPQPSFVLAMSLAALVLLPAAFLYSVAASRISFYLFPVSIAVLSTIPEISKQPRTRTFLRYVVIVYGIVTLTTWMELANHAYKYKPYDNVLLSPF
jgi:hypothetical protein